MKLSSNKIKTPLETVADLRQLHCRIQQGVAHFSFIKGRNEMTHNMFMFSLSSFSTQEPFDLF